MLTLCDADVSGTWSTSGVILFRLPGGLWRVNATGGQPSLVLSNGTSLRDPQFLPDGRHFLFISGASGTSAALISLGSLDGAAPKPLVNGTLARWLAGDRLLYRDQGRLMSQRLDVERGELTGDTQLVANGVGDFTFSSATGGASTSRNGTIAYRADRIRVTEIGWVDRAGRPIGDPVELNGEVWAAEVSPDGTQIAVDTFSGSNRDVWLLNPARAQRTRLTFGVEADGFPVWTPDGQSVAFESSPKGNFDIYTKPTNGSTQEQPLLEAPGQQWPVDYSKDGRFLLYYDQVNSGDLLALPLAGPDRRPVVVAATAASESVGAISPDSRWVAYQTTESGRSEVVVQGFPRAAGKWQVSTNGGTMPRWSGDGKELYFCSGGAVMAVAIRASGDSVATTAPVKLFALRAEGTPLRQTYAVSRDGKFLVRRAKDALESAPITVVLNWKPKAEAVTP